MFAKHGNDGRRIYLKQCPRCNGDIHAGNDQYGKYIHCLQCGYSADVERPNPFALLLTGADREDVA